MVCQVHNIMCSGVEAQEKEADRKQELISFPNGDHRAETEPFSCGVTTTNSSKKSLEKCHFNVYTSATSYTLYTLYSENSNLKGKLAKTNDEAVELQVVGREHR